MSLFKCKMCGGNVEFENGATVGVCDSCGTKQTLPRLDDEKRANLYDRANHFRRNNEYDKAMGIYEQILSEDSTDSESYWSLVLCRYGIEYVEDPATHKRVPTVNRAQFTSIFADEDYKSALQYADGCQKEIYEQEAKAIDEIQKGILAISQKEEPFDVFICYKETDSNGRRTQDSVLANDLYHQLTQEGFKVFFSRITLEDKLGTAYEPYIFAALNSAKVMVVLGTKPEYFNAVWVKNEWSRYLALIKQSGGKRILIPAYRDMDPYDLPDEFSHLQAQDMSKLGFIQDLIRGIKKIISVDEPKPTVIKETVISDVNNDTSPLLKRAFMFLEDKNWQEADEYCEKVLDRNPECAEAYLGKLMAELQVCKIENLADCDEPFDNNNNYQKAVRFADNNLANTFKHINECNKNARLEKIYAGAVKAMEFANTQSEFEIAAQKFEEIAEYKDSSDLIEKCREEAENKRKDDIYNSALATIKTTYDKIAGYEAAVEMFESISGWKDADEQILICQRKIEEIKAKKEAERLEAERKAEEHRLKAEKAAKRRKKIIAITTPIVCVCIAFVIILTTTVIPKIKHKKLLSLMENEYTEALSLIDVGHYDKAYTIFKKLGDYKDSAEKAGDIRLKNEKNMLKIAEIGSCIKYGAYEQDGNKSNGKEDIEWLILEIKEGNALVISNLILDSKKYNNDFNAITWEYSSLRNWLNNDFYNAAFSENEKSLILTQSVSADINPDYNIDPGNSTEDKVFLLSTKEVNFYFNSDAERVSKPTTYAIDNGSRGGLWWLRSPGDRPEDAALVADDGDVYGGGYLAGLTGYGVRPAMWINLS